MTLSDTHPDAIPAARTSATFPNTGRVGRWLTWIPQLDSENTAERLRAALLYGSLLLLAALILRFAGMASENFWHDEVTMLNIGLQGWDYVIDQFHTVGRPPAFGVIAFVWTAWFGTGEVVSRLPSLIASVLSVAILFRLGSEMFSQRVGFLAALLMTVTEFHIYYAQTYRYYAVYVAMVLLSFWFFYRTLKRPRWSDGVLYLLFTALAFYTHAHGMFAIAAQGIFFVLMLLLRPAWRNRRQVGRWLLYQLVLAVLIFPGLWEYMLAGLLTSSQPTSTGAAVVDADVGLNWLQVPTLGSFARALGRFLIFEWVYINLYGIWAALLVGIVGLVLVIRRASVAQWLRSIGRLPIDVLNSQPRRATELALVICWLVAMLVLPWVLSFLVVPMFYDRYVLGASPAFYLLLALIVVGIRRVVPPSITASAFLIFLVPGMVVFYTQPDNEEWHDLTRYVSEHEAPGDTVVVLTSSVHLAQPLEAFNWYYAGTADCAVYEDRLTEPATLDDLTQCLHGHSRAWIVGLRWKGDFDALAAAGYSGSLREFFAEYDSGAWQLAETWETDPFYNLGLYLYENGSPDAGIEPEANGTA